MRMLIILSSFLTLNAFAECEPDGSFVKPNFKYNIELAECATQNQDLPVMVNFFWSDFKRPVLVQYIFHGASYNPAMSGGACSYKIAHNSPPRQPPIHDS